MKYFEFTKLNKRQSCRIDDFLQYHQGSNEVARGKRSIALLSELMGEEAVLLEEKINFKLSGYNGFIQHQDYPNFLSFGQSYYITMMLAIDDCTIDNGCLQEVTREQFKDNILPQVDDQTIRHSVINELTWVPVECKAGTIEFFNSFSSHYSAPNYSDRSRRAVFMTYNRSFDSGSKREKYYSDKRSKFPPECEGKSGIDYSSGAYIYNVANPIVNEVEV